MTCTGQDGVQRLSGDFIWTLPVFLGGVEDVVAVLDPRALFCC